MRTLNLFENRHAAYVRADDARPAERNQQGDAKNAYVYLVHFYLKITSLGKSR